MRDKQYLDMMNQWLILKQEGKNAARYFQIRGYRSIAIYGMALYGRHVVRELQDTDIKVVYGIDRQKLKPYRGVEVRQPVETLPHVDVIVNTVIYDHANIQKTLAQITNVPVVSLEDVVYDSYDE